ncbi:MAG: ACT domain-containing protein [Oscillospiraceae bacterium]|nr:ACT domain-containing protein [Oscillospiraceae bacterium]MBR1845202.1 ACT domain-containing protein [Oscillospiraceae bacterium]
MSKGITKIAYASDITLITLSSLPCDSRAVAAVLTALSDHGVNVDMISQTAPQGGTIRLSFTISDQSLADALAVLAKLRQENPAISPEILPGNSKLAFYDENMVHTPGVAAKVFSLLSEADIQIMLVTTSEVDISILVSGHDLSDALTVMCENFDTEPVETEF